MAVVAWWIIRGAATAEEHQQVARSAVVFGGRGESSSIGLWVFD